MFEGRLNHLWEQLNFFDSVLWTVYKERNAATSTTHSYSFSLPHSGCSMRLSSMHDRPTVSTEDSQCIPLLDCDGD
jgi:hypothetical protein